MLGFPESMPSEPREAEPRQPNKGRAIAAFQALLGRLGTASLGSDGLLYDSWGRRPRLKQPEHSLVSWNSTVPPSIPLPSQNKVQLGLN